MRRLPKANRRQLRKVDKGPAVLRHVQAMTFKQIATALGISHENVRQIYRRAIAKLIRKHDGLVELAAALERIRNAQSNAQRCIEVGEQIAGTAGGYRHGKRTWKSL